MDLKGNNKSRVCICGKFPQEQCICIRNVSFKYGVVAFSQVLWDFLIFITTIVDIWLGSGGLFSPSLLTPTPPGFPPQRMLDQHGFLPWPCCGSVCSCSKCAIHAGLFPPRPPGFACLWCVTGRSSLLVMGGSHLFAFKYIHDLFLWGGLKLEIELKCSWLTSQTSARSHFVL